MNWPARVLGIAPPRPPLQPTNTAWVHASTGQHNCPTRFNSTRGSRATVWDLGTSSFNFSITGGRKEVRSNGSKIVLHAEGLNFTVAVMHVTKVKLSSYVNSSSVFSVLSDVLLHLTVLTKNNPQYIFIFRYFLTSVTFPLFTAYWHWLHWSLVVLIIIYYIVGVAVLFRFALMCCIWRLFYV